MSDTTTTTTTSTVNLNTLNANVSGAMLYYVSRFCNRPTAQSIADCYGIRLSPHASGTGVVAVALNGHSMGMFYDEQGVINGTCSFDLDSSFLKSLKPSTAHKKAETVHDVRVALENGQAMYTTAKGMTASAVLKKPTDPFPNIENIISYMEKTDERQLDTMALNLKDIELFKFHEYTRGSYIFITQYKNKIKNDKEDIFGNYFYVVRNMGAIPFKFFGVTMPVKADADTLAAGYGIPEWYTQPSR